MFCSSRFGSKSQNASRVAFIYKPPFFLHVTLNCRSEFSVVIQKVTGDDVGVLNVT